MLCRVVNISIGNHITFGINEHAKFFRMTEKYFLKVTFLSTNQNSYSVK